MANGTNPPQQTGTVPGTTQPTSYTPAAQQYQLESQMEPQAPPPAEPATPELPQEVAQELSQLRSFRDSVGPLAPLVDQLGGDALYQHYSNYAQLLQDRQQQQQRPQQRQEDTWDTTTTEDELPEIQTLREQLVAANRRIDELTQNTGMDKVASHSQRFFEQEFPDLTDDERKTINDGMRRQFQGYAQSDQGRAFLSNPTYEAVRTLALQHLDSKKLEEVYRRKFERESRTRSGLSTDSYRPSRPAEEEVDWGNDFMTAWERSEAIARREIGG